MTTDPERWANLSPLGMATARWVGTRLLLGLTTVAIARELRTPRSYVANIIEELGIELDESEPSADELRALARRL